MFLNTLLCKPHLNTTEKKSDLRFVSIVETNS